MTETEFLYHITDYNNIESILKYGQLLSINMINQSIMEYKNIAHDNIQLRRAQKNVPLPPYGTLHDYVPFYFSPRPPMLYSLSQGNVEGYNKGQDEIVYLVTSTDKIQQSGLSYVYTDGHALMGFTEFYHRLEDLYHVDWNVMSSKYWFDTEEDPDRKRRRQAEFLVYKGLPIDLLLGFAVKSEKIKQRLEKLLELYQLSIGVGIRDWYY